MKKDNLERFVRDNREAFDDKEPSGNLWRKIEAGLDNSGHDGGADGINGLPNPIMPFRQIHTNIGRADRRSTGWLGSRQIGWPMLDWRIAASIAVLLLAGAFLYMNGQYGVTHQPEIVASYPTYAKEVVHYTKLIDDKRTELKQMTEDNPALYKEFATDLDRLENSYRSLKADLPQNPNQEVLIQAMIQNLQLQINLLNEQLRVIQRIKQQTNETTPV
ncbi:hypothetical protein IC229_25385 [Spirosoma sp. BT702]|uniref:Uncharacterized protein n=1 Tax=Spirosoma profusum TaxID=2771354 RepID=A0A926XZV3_9BACT|nr:hypothetical protein [Spirosoma profusum]MBD2704003.1 hypothetical protein [Spirosoma profusum]